MFPWFDQNCTAGSVSYLCFPCRDEEQHARALLRIILPTEDCEVCLSALLHSRLNNFRFSQVLFCLFNHLGSPVQSIWCLHIFLSISGLRLDMPTLARVCGQIPSCGEWTGHFPSVSHSHPCEFSSARRGASIISASCRFLLKAGSVGCFPRVHFP